MFPAISPASRVWRPRLISVTICVVVVLTILSAWLIFLAIRQHQMMGALSLLLASACVLLLFLTIISRRSERLIHSLDRDLRSLVESAPIVMLTVSRRGMVLRWNERLARLTSTRGARLLTELFSREHWPALETALKNARARGE